MGYKEITVPAAGESEAFPITGVSILVLSSPNYFSVADCPKLSFDNAGDQVPLKATAKWPNSPGEFKQVIITGTADSAGDKIILLSTNVCVDPYYPPANDTHEAEAGNTIIKTMDGTVQQITEIELQDADGNLPQSIYVAAAGADINYMWNDGNGTDPSEGGDNYVLVDGAEPLEIQGLDFMLNWRFINAVNAETPDLLITPRY